MPLIRKSQNNAAVPTASPDSASTQFEDRWADVRDMTTRQDVVALAAALASESNSRLQATIFMGFARIATTDAVNAVLPYLRKDDAALRNQALDALRAMPQAARLLMENLLRDPDPDVRLLACEILRDAPGADASGLLCRLLDHEADSNVCGAAIDVLAEIGESDAIPSLTACAQRFQTDPFLTFAIKIATDRLSAHPAP